MNLPLNIDWQQILLHLFNFVVLFAILYYLLYKPVKDFMDKRMEHYNRLNEEAKSNLEISEKTKEEYINKLAAADEEISEKRAQAHKEFEEAGEAIIQQAKKDAEKIVAEAHETLDRERAKMLKEAQNEISGMVVSATEKIISSTSESFEQFLSTVERGGDSE